MQHVNWFAVAVAVVWAAGAQAAAVRVTSYSMPNGESAFGTIHYHDETYNGTGNKTSDRAPLSGGTGDLTDGRTAAGSNNLGDPAWVAWQTINPTITFHFEGSQRVDRVTLHFANSQGAAGVRLPRTITVTIGGQTRTLDLTNYSGPNPAGTVVDTNGLSGTSASVTLTRDGEWVFLDEVSFEGESTPTPICTVSASVSSVAIPVPSVGGSGAIPVSALSDCTWTAAGSPSWLTVSPAGGTGDGVIHWAASANPGTAPRTATITVASAGNTLTQSVTQAGSRPAGLRLSSSVSIARNAGGARAPVYIGPAPLAPISPRAPETPQPVIGEAVVTFSDTITSTGTGDAANTTITRTVPSGLLTTSCLLSTGALCEGLGGGNLTGSAGTLASGQSITMTTQAVVQVTLPNGTILTAPVAATASGADPTPDDTTTFKVVPSATTTYPLTLTTEPPNGGTLTVNPQSPDGRYLSGTILSVAAVPAAGYQLAGFSGDLTGLTNDQTVTMNQARNVKATFAPTANAGMRFVPVIPCRVVDTRLAAGPFGGGILTGGTVRDFPIPGGACAVPSTAAAYSFNTTVVPQATLGYLTLWPTGQPQPLVSTLNSLDGRIKANSAIVPAGANGSVRVFVTETSHVILDINGYFVPGSVPEPNALSFYPVTPCRVADTRNAVGALGGPALTGGQARTFAVTSSPCGIPASAKAYSLNLTAVPRTALGFLTTWPAGSAQPFVSTLNAPTGTVVANAAIVPAGTNGGIGVYATDASDLVIDINGYFAAPGGTGQLKLYPLNPCRIVDTRNTAGSFGGPILAPGDTRSFTVPSSGCGVPTAAKAYVLNATVVPTGLLGFLTLWPAGAAMPLASTLNALDGAITANAAIVPASAAGVVSTYVTNSSHLVVDINGYFAP